MSDCRYVSDCRFMGRETADPWFGSSIPTRSHTFAEIDHELISTAILLPFADSRMVVVSYKQKYVHELLVNRLVKLAQEKKLVRWTDRLDMTIVVDWDVKNQTKQTNWKKIYRPFYNVFVFIWAYRPCDKSDHVNLLWMTKFEVSSGAYERGWENTFSP